MLKQVVIFRRIETIALELPVLQALARASLEEWANSQSGVGSPGRVPVSHVTTDWTPISAKPGFGEAKAISKATSKRRAR